MLIIRFGRRIVTRTHGWTALFCPYCRDLVAAKVVERFSQLHISVIPLGAGRPLGYLADCPECGAHFAPDRDLVKKAVQEPMPDFVAFCLKTRPDREGRLQRRLAMERKLRTDRKSLSEGEEAVLGIEPFTSADPLLADNKTADGVATLGCISLATGLVVVPFICWEFASVLKSLSHGLLWACSIGSAILGLIVGIALLRAARRMNRTTLAKRLIVRALQPLNPTQEQLIIWMAVARKQGSQGGALITGADLHARLQAAGDAIRTGGPGGTEAPAAAGPAPFTTRFLPVLEAYEHGQAGPT
ncbi:MAG: hypothetical protein ACREJ2_08400 [Planctomycetota bacterium]